MTASGSQTGFPPPEGAYSGDYIYITEPGHYTLEHPVSHSYQVGIIIASSSVVLDGQGYLVRPLGPGSDPTVGIWVRMTDLAGKPLTGVTIRNISIANEDYGIYVEGTDTAAFSWGSNRTGDPDMSGLLASPRTLTLSRVDITGSGDGIRIGNHPGVLVTGSAIVDASGSGVVIEDSAARIVESLISGSQKNGVEVHDCTTGEISSCTINQSKGAGIRFDGVSGFRVFNTILQNRVNLVVGSNSTGILLQAERKDGTNIIGGKITGGNYWISDDPKIPGSDSIPDADGDGIGDMPYDPGFGFTDMLPLVMPRVHQVLTLIPQAPVLPHETIQTQTPVPLQTPLSFISGFHAAIVGDSIPQTMKRGTEYPVSLQLCNDGSEDWIPDQKVGIKAVEDTVLYSPEWIPAPVTGPVHQGTVLNLTVSLRSPSAPGVYTLKFQAVRGGSGVEVLFGRPYTRTVTVQ